MSLDVSQVKILILTLNQNFYWWSTSNDIHQDLWHGKLVLSSLSRGKPGHTVLYYFQFHFISSIGNKGSGPLPDRPRIGFSWDPKASVVRAPPSRPRGSSYSALFVRATVVSATIFGGTHTPLFPVETDGEGWGLPHPPAGPNPFKPANKIYLPRGATVSSGSELFQELATGR